MQQWLDLQIRDDRVLLDTFVVFIQIGAILAVVVYFRQRILDLLTGRAAASREQPRPVAQAG